MLATIAKGNCSRVNRKISMFKNGLTAIYNYLEQQTKDASHQITLFGIVMMINYPLFGVFWKIESIQIHNEFSLRLIATLLCALLALNKFWPRTLLKALPVIWYVALLFCLPYFFGYLTLVHHGSTVWLMNCVSAIFFLLLLTSVLGALSLLILGTGLAFIFYYYLSGNILQYIPGNISLFSLSITYTAAIIIGALFARDREITHAGRLLGLRMLAGSIAHDLRTPLASIHLQAELQENILKKLNNLEIKKDLKDNLDKINRSIELSNQLISMQLNNIQQNRIDTTTFTIYPIRALLENALCDYPLKEEQKPLIKLSFEADFYIWFDEVLFKNLIWNLLKNSFEFIEATGKGTLSIWVQLGSENDNFNYLYIKDTAKGLYSNQVHRVFATFYSQRPDGTGIGLAYSKTLMKAAGGDIVCEGRINEFAQFILKFPKVD